MKTIHCSVCGKPIRGYTFEERMAKLRRHYKKSHPRKFREWIRKSVETRKKRYG